MAQPYENKTIDDVLELWLFGRICGSATHQVNGNRLKYR